MTAEEWVPVGRASADDDPAGPALWMLSHLLGGDVRLVESAGGSVAAICPLESLRASARVEVEGPVVGDEIATVIAGGDDHVDAQGELTRLLRSTGLVAIAGSDPSPAPGSAVEVGRLRLQVEGGPHLDLTIYGPAPSLVGDLFAAQPPMPVPDEDLDARGDWFERRHGDA